VICGRDQERSRIGELLDGARDSRSAALLILGEPGVGKTALLDDARAQAVGVRVLSGSGVESEAHLPFAVLHQLLRPVVGLVENLPPPQAAALSGALGLTAGGGDDRFLVSLAALSLLAEAADQEPLVCLVDDAQWLDDASADTLLFVARRLGAEGIVMLFGLRAGEGRPFDDIGIPVLRLRGLDATASGMLIDQQTGRVLSPAVRERLLAEAEGNPLALIELSSALSEAQLSGVEPVLSPIPVGARVEQSYLARVRLLPDAAQTLLVVAAADDTGDLAIVLGAAAKLGAGSAALDAAEGASLVRSRGGRLEFRHPLVRSAVYQAAPFSKRQAVHRALANVLDGEVEADRRAWHRAAASAEPDRAVVDELEQAARRARRRSAFAAASLALERAAALTPDQSLRAPRLTAAAENAWLAGHLDRASTLLERGGSLASDSKQRSDVDHWRGLIELNGGRPADAYQLLVRAAAEMTPVDSGSALYLLNTASVAASFAGDRTADMEIANMVEALTVEQTPFAQMMRRLLIGLGAFAKQDFASATASLRRTLALGEEIERDARVEEPASPRLFAGRAAIFLGDDEGNYTFHRQLAAHARASGALGTLVQALPRLAHAEIWAGRWASASASAREGLELASEIGQHNLHAHLLTVRALVAAHRGDDRTCRSLAAEGRDLAAARELVISVDTSYWAILLLELGLGRSHEGFRAASEISGTVMSFCSGFDRVEAAIRDGKRDTARKWLRPFEKWGDSNGSAWVRATAMHCRALLAEDERDAERMFITALDTHATANRPFERARTELACGELLRRTGRRVAARQHLAAALDSFETLGATLWSERARVELRASGQTARKRDPSMSGTLTAQELQVAHFVSEGLSNREVAAQLFLSPRTIDAHLRAVFRKLGITSRTQLARLDLDASRGAPSSWANR
jgi:DNA-binding CsgD family transcriptional regulator